MDTIQSLEWRYATKKFDATKKLPPQKIEVIKKAFNLTPTSYGLQPSKLVIVSNKELQEKLMQHTGNQQPIVTASHLLVFCIQTTIDHKLIEENFALQKEIRNTPNEILQPYKEFLLNHFAEKTQEQKEEWASQQVFLAMGNILNTCAQEKIDACPMEGFDSKMYDETLNLKEIGLKSVLILPIGYRAKDDIFAGFKKVRRPQEDVIVEFLD